MSDPAAACFVSVSNGTYGPPLDTTSARKFETLRPLGRILVVSLSTGLRPRSFERGACFFLLPRLPGIALRYLMLYSVGVLLLVVLILRERVTVLVAQSPYEGAAAAFARRLATLAGRRVALVVESHGDFETAPLLQRRRRFAGAWRRLIGRVSRFALAEADALRAISEATAAQLRTWAPSKPLVQFPTWTDISVFLAASREKRRSPGPPLVLYAGVLTPLKGVHHLLDAFATTAAAFRQARLTLVGASPDPDYARRLERQAASPGLAGRVAFVPAVSQADLAGWMARASVLVLPSLSEGLGRVLFESMACGTPVIASAVGGTTEVVRHGENGFLVPPGDVAALAERLAWLLGHPEEARQLGENGRTFAEGFFSPERYLAGYQQLLAVARRAAGLDVSAEGP